MTRKQRPLRLRQASAHFRVAAKFDRAGQHASAARHREIAERLVREERRQRAARLARVTANRLDKEGKQS